MNRIVLAMITAMLLIPISGMAVADHHGHKHGAKMDRMATQLELTDEQRSQVETVMQEQRQKHKTLRTETRERIDAILTDEQSEKLETMRAERKQKWQERRRQHRDRKGSRD